MSKEFINWGIIGCGKVVQNKVGFSFNRVSNSKLYAVMRRDLNSAKDSANRLNATKWYDDIDKLLDDSNIDAIYIATPPGLHYSQAIKCARKKKPTYIEKPFARNITEAKEVVNEFKSNNTPLFVAHYRRALKKFIKIKSILENGVIGKICEVDVRLKRIYSKEEKQTTWLYNPVLSGGGKFFDIAAHTIDLLIYLLGPIKDLNSYVTNNNSDYNVEDIVVFSFVTENGVIGTANFNTLSQEKTDKIIISGTKGEIIFSVHGNSPITINCIGDKKDIYIENPEFIEEPMIQSVVNHLTGVGTCPCTGEDALQTVYIIDKILTEFYNGREDDFWNRPDSWGTNTK